MPDDALRRFERIVTTYDLTWLLDLHRNKQLDLDPSYQRKSVWTPKDRRFFMDTVFRNFPSPAIFLHKTIDDATGTTTYHVVDGKQRINTILMYVQNKFALSSEFGDDRFDGKRWRDFKDEPIIRRLLWNYRITVEELDDASFNDINDVFSRLNKNASKLTPQELRHARFDGWLITELEREVEDPVWKDFKIRTAAKERRMTDIQNLAELAAVTIRRDVSGFSQIDLDQLFAEYDDPTAEESEFDAEDVLARFAGTKQLLSVLEATASVVSEVAQPFLHLYTLWTLLTRRPELATSPMTFARDYGDFMRAVAEHELDESAADADQAVGSPIDRDSPPSRAELVAQYKRASVGATTDEPKRRERLSALELALENVNRDEGR
jgi:hypothetical protein